MKPIIRPWTKKEWRLVAITLFLLVLLSTFANLTAIRGINILERQINQFEIQQKETYEAHRE
jgi:hypothetical protein